MIRLRFMFYVLFFVGFGLGKVIIPAEGEGDGGGEGGEVVAGG